MKKPNLNKAIREHVLKSIDLESYEIDSLALTDKQKLEKVFEIAKKEYCHEYNLRRYKGNYHLIISEWLAGLPTICTVHFANYDILEFAKSKGYFFRNEKEEDLFIESWFRRCAMIIINPK